MGFHAAPRPRLRHAREKGERFLCGRIHPLFRLRTAMDALTLPCFHLRHGRLVLSSSGSFSGGHLIRPEADDRVFIIAGNEAIGL